VATSRLQIYNDALLLLGQRSIASLTVNEEGRRLLDQVWNGSGLNTGGVQACLEQGQWKFATRSSKFEYNTDVTPDFGYQFVFDKPSDWLETVAVCTDEYFLAPLLQYSDENQFWMASVNPLYIKYVSSDADYGGNLAIWPVSFREFVVAYFASKIVHKTAPSMAEKILGTDGSGQRNGILHSARLTAQNRDAWAGPTKVMAPGSWVQSRRRYGNGNWRDGGSRSSLIG
jgi:hypothetical protein